MDNQLNELAKKIINQNQYMTIGTADEAGNAWVSPVAYAQDNDWNIYFVTMPTSRHGKNLEKNSKASVTIFDSQQLWGEGIGVWIEGTIKRIPVLQSSKAALTYFNRKYPFGNINSSFGMGLKKLLSQKMYYFYVLIPEKVWISDPNADERIEVSLA